MKENKNDSFIGLGVLGFGIIFVLICIMYFGTDTNTQTSHNQTKVSKIKEKSEYMSVLALWGNVSGIDLEGFLYPMKNGTLYPFESLGISNEITGRQGTIRIREGCLLVIRSRD